MSGEDRKLRKIYPVHKFPDSHSQLPQEAEVFRHYQCIVSLANPGPPYQLHSRKQPLCVRPKDGNCTFYLVLAVKGTKEVLFNLLKPEEVQEEIKVEPDCSRQLLQCRLLVEDLAGLQMINVLSARLCMRFLT